MSFDRSDLVENVRAAMMAISNLKPEVIKGKYITQVKRCGYDSVYDQVSFAVVFTSPLMYMGL